MTISKDFDIQTSTPLRFGALRVDEAAIRSAGKHVGWWDSTIDKKIDEIKKAGLDPTVENWIHALEQEPHKLDVLVTNIQRDSGDHFGRIDYLLVPHGHDLKRNRWGTRAENAQHSLFGYLFKSEASQQGWDRTNPVEMLQHLLRPFVTQHDNTPRSLAAFR